MTETTTKTLRTRCCALRPDAQAFDEVRIETVPRWKTSGMSGDEWRISAVARFYRKGQMIFEEHCRNVQTACGLVYGWYVSGSDDGKGYFAGDGLTCDQEGCHEPATVRYARVKDYCRQGHQSVVFESSAYRHFCEEHKRRGDCGLDDADANYVLEPMPERAT